MSFITSEKGKRLTLRGNTEEERTRYKSATEEVYKNVNIVNFPSLTVVLGYLETTSKMVDVNNTRDQYIVGQISKDEFVKYINGTYLPAYKDVISLLQKHYDTKLKK